MPTSAELREASRLARQAARAASVPLVKRHLASRALALAQLAEKVEREEAALAKMAPEAR